MAGIEHTKRKFDSRLLRLTPPTPPDLTLFGQLPSFVWEASLSAHYVRYRSMCSRNPRSRQDAPRQAT